MNWLQYLLEANLYLCIFYAGYSLLLSKETHYQLNRAYLLLSCIIAFIIPFLQIGFLKVDTAVTVVTGYVSATGNGQAVAQAQPVFNWQDALLYMYVAGVTVAILLFAIKLYKLFRLIKRHHIEQENGYKLINIDEQNTAFSFFNYLFIGQNTTGTDTITRHELVHITQKHSADIVFTEFVKALNWFNPFAYLLQNSLKTVHEYIADEQTALTEGDSLSYSTFLLNNAYGLQGMPAANSFFNYNLLKKRIIMLNQQRSGKLARLKYLVAVPLIGGMLCASTLSFSKNYAQVDLLPQKGPEKNTTLLAPVKATNTGSAMYTKVNSDSPKMYKAILLGKDTPEMVLGTVVKPQSTFVAVDQAGQDTFQLVLDTDTTATVKGKTMNVIMQEPPASARPKRMPAKVSDFSINTPFTALLEYVSKHVRYPAAALDKKIVGAVNAEFTLDAQGNIDGAGIFSGIGSGCDEEVIRVLKNYKGAIKQKPGKYSLAVMFSLVNKDDSKIEGRYPIPHIDGWSAGVVNIVGFLK